MMSLHSGSGIRLGVNIDHVATLRQARGCAYPDLVAAARLAERGGADNITVHLREDRRHIQDSDLRILLEGIPLPLNLEMSLAPEIVEQARLLRPPMVCIVPEHRAERTTERGLSVRTEMKRLRPIVELLSAREILVSLFVDAVPEEIEAAGSLSVHAIELHTGPFADSVDDDTETMHWQALARSAEQAHQLGLEVHAGHGLHYGNIQKAASLPYLRTCNIGHAIVCESVLTGMEQAVRRMKSLIRNVGSA